MEKNPLFKQYRRKLITEAVLKSVMMSATIAFSVSAVLAFVMWFTPVSGTWYAVGALLIVFSALVPAFYFLRYRPNDEDIARRLDACGLDERMITMTEYGARGDDSYIVKRQKADAETALTTKLSGAKALTFAISGLAAIPLAATMLLSGGMITVNALADEGVINSGNKVIESIFDNEDEKFYSLVYRVAGTTDGQTYAYDEGGVIDGVDDQLVVAGGSGTPVVAVADEDWAFLGWDLDKATDIKEVSQDPYRCDVNIAIDATNTEINEDGYVVITHTAFFAMMSDGEDPSDGDPSDGPQSDEDAPSDAPSDGDNSESQNQSSSSNSGNGEGDDNDSAGGNYNPSKDNIIDGTKNYRDLYDQYYQEAMSILESGGEIPEYYKKIIEDYYGILI